MRVAVSLLVLLASRSALRAQTTEWTLRLTTAMDGVTDRSELVLSAKQGSQSGFDGQDHFHPPGFTHDYIDLMSVHAQSDAGWSLQPDPTDTYMTEVFPPFGEQSRTIPHVLSTARSGSMRITWALDENGALARYRLLLHDGATTIDMWTAGGQYLLNASPGVRAMSLELIPGRATKPVAYGATLQGVEDTPLMVTMKGSDWDGCDLTFTIFDSGCCLAGLSPIVDDPCVTGEPGIDTARVVVTPRPDYTGGFAFQYYVTDATGRRSDSARVSIDFANVNDPPTARDSAIPLLEDTPTAVPMAPTDPDGNCCFYFLATPPAHGTVTIPAGFGAPMNATYTPDRNYIGPDSFTWRGRESFGGLFTNDALVSLTVNPADGPVAILSVPSEAGAGDTVLADGSGSFHRFPPKSIVSYAFDFGDGTAAYTESASAAPDGAFDGRTTHVYGAVGTYTVTLTVRDSQSPSKSDSITAAVKIPGRDLSVTDVDASAIRYDGQALTVSGLAIARVVNLGATEVSRPFDVLFFEDRDGDGAYGAGVDGLLGQTTVAAPLRFSEKRTVAASVSGSVSFAHNRIFAAVDPANVIAETHEDNNVADSSAACKVFAPTQTFNTAVRWWTKTFSVLSQYNQVDVGPMAADLNGDGIKDVVCVSSIGGHLSDIGYVRALDGRNGAELWTQSQHAGIIGMPPAIGDIIDDPGHQIELVSNTFPEHGLMLMRTDGSLI